MKHWTELEEEWKQRNRGTIRIGFWAALAAAAIAYCLATGYALLERSYDSGVDWHTEDYRPGSTYSEP